MSRRGSWPLEGLVACCGLHAPPDKRHKCGLYAFTRLPPLGLVAKLEMRFSRCAVGVVVGWGKLQSHGNGWRAERARPVAVADGWWLSSKSKTRLEAAGIPVVPLKALDEIALEHGAHLPLRREGRVKRLLYGAIPGTRSTLVSAAWPALILFTLAWNWFMASAISSMANQGIGSKTGVFEWLGLWGAFFLASLGIIAIPSVLILVGRRLS